MFHSSIRLFSSRFASLLFSRFSSHSSLFLFYSSLFSTLILLFSSLQVLSSSLFSLIYSLSLSPPSQLVTIPVPRATTSCKCSLPDNAKGQTAEYSDQDKAVQWTIKKFPGQTEQQIRLRLSVAGPQSRSEIGPVSLEFEIPMWNPSTMAIRFLRIIERSDMYKPQRWVRVISQANSYTCRIV